MTSAHIPVPEIIQELERYDGTYKRKYVDAALAQKKEIIPSLIKILEDVFAAPHVYVDDYDYMGHTFALLLLGHFGEPQAHQVIIDLVSLPDDLPYELFSDTITENLAAILFRTADGEFDSVKALVANIEADDYCRSAAARSLVFAVAEGIADRADIVNFFGPVFADEMIYPDSEFLTFLSDSICNLNPQELIELIRLAFQLNKIDTSYIGDLSDYEKALEKPIEQCLEEQRKELQRYSPTDFHSSMQWWACFQKEPVTEKKNKRGKRRKKN